MLLEGFLSLHNPEVRKLLNYRVYLDIPLSTTITRRTKQMPNGNNVYNDLILPLMHAEHVEPTKQFADLVINVENKTANEVKQIVKTHLLAKHIL